MRAFLWSFPAPSLHSVSRRGELTSHERRPLSFSHTHISLPGGDALHNIRAGAHTHNTLYGDPRSRERRRRTHACSRAHIQPVLAVLSRTYSGALLGQIRAAPRTASRASPRAPRRQTRMGGRRSRARSPPRVAREGSCVGAGSASQVAWRAPAPVAWRVRAAAGGWHRAATGTACAATASESGGEGRREGGRRGRQRRRARARAECSRSQIGG